MFKEFSFLNVVLGISNLVFHEVWELMLPSVQLHWPLKCLLLKLLEEASSSCWSSFPRALCVYFELLYLALGDKDLTANQCQRLSLWNKLAIITRTLALWKLHSVLHTCFKLKNWLNSHALCVQYYRTRYVLVSPLLFAL